MRRDKLNLGVILRVMFSLIPILFGMPVFAVILCTYNIVMSFVVFGPLNAFVSALTATCLSMLLCGTYGEAAKLTGLFIALEAVLCSIACIYSAVIKKKFFFGVCLTSLGYLIPGFINLRMEAAEAGLSVIDYLVSAPMEMVRSQLGAVLSQTQQTEHIDAIIEITSNFTAMIVPSILIISSLFVGYVIMWSIAVQMRKHPQGIRHSFSEIRIPRTALPVLIISAVSLIFLIKSDFMFVPVNLIMVIIAVYFFAGVSFVDFYLRRGIKNTFFRILIHILVIVSASSISAILPVVNVFVIYALLAIIDSFLNFRKLSLDTDMRGEENETENGAV